jgi:hypothetical protein
MEVAVDWEALGFPWTADEESEDRTTAPAATPTAMITTRNPVAAVMAFRRGIGPIPRVLEWFFINSFVPYGRWTAVSSDLTSGCLDRAYSGRQHDVPGPRSASSPGIELRVDGERDDMGGLESDEHYGVPNVPPILLLPLVVQTRRVGGFGVYLRIFVSISSAPVRGVPPTAGSIASLAYSPSLQRMKTILRSLALRNFRFLADWSRPGHSSGAPAGEGKQHAPRREQVATPNQPQEDISRDVSPKLGSPKAAEEGFQVHNRYMKSGREITTSINGA